MSSLQLFATVSVVVEGSGKGQGLCATLHEELANVYTLLAIGMSLYPCPGSRGLSKDLV
jgi:hypothetical protein